MEKDLLKLELENIERYCSGEKIDTNQTHIKGKQLSNDQWTEFLYAYLSNDQNVMAQYIGKIDQMNWCEEDKLWWNILLLTKCDGSDEDVYKIIQKLEMFKYENATIEELLINLGNIFLKREIQVRKIENQIALGQLHANVNEKKEMVDTAKENLRSFRLTANRRV